MQPLISRIHEKDILPELVYGDIGLEDPVICYHWDFVLERFLILYDKPID